MNDEWRNMRHVGWGNGVELFQGKDGRVVSVTVPSGTTMNQAQRLAYRQWKGTASG